MISNSSLFFFIFDPYVLHDMFQKFQSSSDRQVVFEFWLRVKSFFYSKDFDVYFDFV